jgi:uncharacterized damage-inducible protein DinB
MTWTAPDIKVPDEPAVADERTLLIAVLDGQRGYLLRKCARLTGEQLARETVPPSNLTLLGLLRHLAKVERAWFRVRLDGQPLPRLYSRADRVDADFEELDPNQAEAAYALLIEEQDLARQAIVGRSLDDTFVHERWGEMSLRWLLLHMTREYAVHNGHADLLREATDGDTGVD